MDSILKVYNVSKKNKKKEILSGININIIRGEIYGLLGPDGAGKTTLLRIITNLIKPTTGEITIFDNKNNDSKNEFYKRTGIIVGQPVFYDNLTVYENLDLHCEYMGYYNKKSISETLKLLNFQQYQNEKVKTLTASLKQKLGIIRAILTKPELLILDEPIDNLDLKSVNEVRQVLKMLNKSCKTTIVLSSQNLNEIENVIDRVGFIVGGKLIKEVSIDEITDDQKVLIEIETSMVKKASYILSDKLEINNFKVINPNIIRIYDQRVPQNEILKQLILEDVQIESLNQKKPTLKEYFINIT